jgi:hypothetical protein
MRNVLLTASLLTAAVPAVAATNLVANPGFENGFDGWTAGGYLNASAADGIGVLPHSGVQFASSGCDEHYCNLSQTLATTIGGRYALDFWFDPGDSAVPGQVSTLVEWNGATLQDIGVGANGYVHYAYAVTASSTATVLNFSGYQREALTAIDDVSVTATVPDAATWTMMIAGFGLVGVGLRRRPGVAARG